MADKPPSSWQRVYRKKRAQEYHRLMHLSGGQWYLDMLSAVVQTLAFSQQNPAQIIELGTGTGRLAQRVLRRLPTATLIGIDGSPDMLKQAHHNLRRFGRRVELSCRNFGQSAWSAGLPLSDAVISTIAIHHLTHAGKKNLYTQILTKLKPGGIFINADPIWPQDTRLKKQNDLRWALYIQERYQRFVGQHKTTSSILSWMNQTRKAEGDKPADLNQQLDWLKQTGYINVDCFWKIFGFAAFGGFKPFSSHIT